MATLLLCVLAATPAAARLDRSPAPAWAEILPLPEVREARLEQVQDGTYYLLVDKQVRFDRSVTQTWSRTAYKIVDRAGLESASRIGIDFDPTDEKIVLHSIVVRRDGQVLDRLANVEIDLLRQEKEIEDDVVTGVMTANLRLRDIRVGDIVDYQFSWISRRSYWPSHYFAQFSTTWGVPVGLTRVRLDMPAAMPIAVRMDRSPAVPKSRLIGDRSVTEFRAADAEPAVIEKATPGWYRDWPQMTVSSFRGWRDVAAWAVPRYPTGQRLPDDFARKIDAIAGASSRPQVRAVAALRLVQDTIRYTSLSIGAGGYTPRAPAEIVASGFGDCKDKALLLVAALTRLGIDAVPALTHSTAGAELPSALPSPGSFDHVVVRLRIAGRTWWVDPTRSSQGGRLEGLAPVTNRYALPIVAGQRALEAIPNPPPAEPQADIVETYTTGSDGSGPLILTVVSIYRASYADDMRDRLARQSPAKIAREYLDYYRSDYPGLERVGSLVTEDDRDGNTLVLREKYRLSSDALAAKGLAKSFRVNASALDNLYLAAPDGPRSAPLGVGLIANLRHRIILDTPGRRPPLSLPVTVDGKTFRYTLATDRDGDIATLDHRVIGKRDVVDADAIDDYRADRTKFSNALFWNLDLTSTDGGVLDDNVGSTIAVVGLFAGIVGLIASIWTIRTALKRQREAGAAQRFHPVAPLLFVIFLFATFGLYGVYWMWMCWRWVKLFGEREIFPLWRAVFSGFWLWPLFAAANERATRPLPVWLGAGAAILYLVGSLAGAIVGRLVPELPWIGFYGMPLMLLFLPAVLAVARANGPTAGEGVGWRVPTSAIVAAAGGAMFVASALVVEFRSAGL